MHKVYNWGFKMEFHLKKRQGPVEVSLSAMLRGRDGIFWLHGGDTPHIGALAIYRQGQPPQTICFEGHREDGIVDTLAGQLREYGQFENIIVCGGIHYNNIPKEWIPEIIVLCRQLGRELLKELYISEEGVP